MDCGEAFCFRSLSLVAKKEKRADAECEVSILETAAIPIGHLIRYRSPHRMKSVTMLVYGGTAHSRKDPRHARRKRVVIHKRKGKRSFSIHKHQEASRNETKMQDCDLPRQQDNVHRGRIIAVFLYACQHDLEGDHEGSVKRLILNKEPIQEKQYEKTTETYQKIPFAAQDPFRIGKKSPNRREEKLAVQSS